MRGFKDDHGKFHPIDGSKGTVGMRVKENSNHVEGIRLKRNNSSGIKKKRDLDKDDVDKLKIDKIQKKIGDDRYDDIYDYANEITHEIGYTGTIDGIDRLRREFPKEESSDLRSILQFAESDTH